MNDHKHAVRELVDIFLGGEKLTREEIIYRFFGEDLSEQKRKESSRTVSYWIHAIKRIIRHEENKFFGQINQGIYGVVDTKEEVTYALTGYARRVRSLATNALLLHDEAISRKLVLPEGIKKESLPIFNVLPAKTK